MRIPVTLSAATQVLLAVTAAMMVFALSAVAQTSGGTSGKGTSPPASWPEKWAGWWQQQDTAGKIAPPGYKVLHSPDEVKELAVALALPWARARYEATDYEIEDAGQICRPMGPMRANQYVEFQLLVSPEKITVVPETGSGHLTAGIRRIYMNRPHLKNPPLTSLGDWVGHWEGDTLVMDGIAFNEKSWLSRDRARHSEALHIVERWRLVANDQWMEKTITVDDRFALTRPFTVTRYHEKVPLTTPIPFKPRGRDSHVPVPGRLCIDGPSGRRGWIRMHKRALQEWDKTRRSLGPEAKATEAQ